MKTNTYLDQVNALALAQAQQTTALQRLELEKARVAADSEATRLRLMTQHTIEKLVAEAQSTIELIRAEALSQRSALEIGTLAARQEVDNQVSSANLQARLIDALPDVLAKMPKPDELRSIVIGGGGADTGFTSEIAQIVAVAKALQEVSAEPRSRGRTP